MILARFLRRVDGTPRQSGGESSRGTVALLAAAFLAVGGLLGLVLAPETPPSPVRGAQAPGYVEVEIEEFRDERQVQLSIRLGPERRVLAPGSGVVTALACEPGATIESGTSPLSLNGTPLVALATPVPLWRDLMAGASGVDVEALQRELERLGFDVGETGRYDAATQRAVTELGERTGAGATNGVLPLASVLWIPDRSSAIASCDIELGATVDHGTPVASLEPEIETVAVSGQPSHLVPGDRRLLVDGVEVTVDGSGTLAEPSDLAALAETDAFTVFPRTDGEVPVHGTYQLVDPLIVAGVPPSAIMAGSGGLACVMADDGSVHHVRVVASMVGRSLVEWVAAGDRMGEAEPPRRVRIDPGDDQRCA